MKAVPTIPFSQEVFGHWAVVLTVLLTATLGYALLAPGTPTRGSRTPSDFELRLVPATGEDFCAAFPEFLRQPPPLEIAVLEELAAEGAAEGATP